MTDPYTLYRSLDPSVAAAGGFAAVPFPEHPSHRVAVNTAGDATILICTRPEPASPALIPVRTQNIEVAFSSPYRVRYPSGESQDEVFTAVTCLSPDPPVVRYFFNLLGALIDTLGANPGIAEVDAAVRSASQLFQALVLPATKAVQGIWAELLILTSSQDVARAASAWHSVPEERYDFAIGPDRLEVKSSGYRQRIHHFSLEQLVPPAGADLWIASLFVERSSGGLTLEALLAEVGGSVDAGENFRIRRHVAETLGASFGNALEMGFDRQLAVESLRYYPSGLIPRVATPLPREVSGVHFRADLNGVTPSTLTGAIAGVFPAPGAGSW